MQCLARRLARTASPMRATSVHHIRTHSSQPESAPAEDDYYALLLSTPTPNLAIKSINPLRAPKSSNSSSSASVPPAAAATQAATALPDKNRIVFSAPLAGPSARMRGLARGERGLDRPPEPDNCCMSGCVNCVWDAYREEIEEWAAGRRKREEEMKISGSRKVPSQKRSPKVLSQDDGGVGGLDDVGGFGAFAGVDLDDEGHLFEGVPVGIREFMKQEKRIRERKESRDKR